MQHLDEGTIHAWLDGALAPNEASAAEAHVQSCAQCAATVAEARGLVAASSRILGALDDVPAVQESPKRPWQPAAQPRRSGWWWRRAGIRYAAAATVLLAAGTTLVLRNVSPDAAMESRSTANEAVQFAAPKAPQVVTDGAASSQASASTAPPTSKRLAQQISDEAQGAARRAKSLPVEPEAKKEELAVDRIVPLPGAMPRAKAPAPTPPPNVRQDERKALADLAMDAAPAARGVVQGRVLDAATGAPVIGAVVSIDTAQAAARTDSAGKFKLQAVPLGQQTVNVRALGFQPVRHPVAVEAKDSVDLAFALQRSTLQLEQVVTTGAAGQAQQGARRDVRDQAQAAREGQRRDSLVKQSQVATPVLRLDGAPANATNVLGCHTLLAVSDKERDADRSMIASMPSRVQLEAAPVARARANEALVSRARTLVGAGRAESWRLVGDSLELAWTDDARRHVLRFSRRDGKWTSNVAIMEPCPSR